MDTARRILVAGVIAALAGAVFAPIAGHGFLSFDDDVYLTDNPVVRRGLSAEGFRWAFTTTRAANWHPLTWLSHMLDVELFGLDPGRHHLVGVALHALIAAVLFLVLAAATGALWRSALVAALFAVHPLHVESVAWAAERKDLLAGLLWFLTTGAYLAHARRPGAVRLAAACLLFALGLLAKPVLVTLPFALLLLDVWPLGRLRLGRRLLAEKAPLFVLSAGSSLVTYLAQRAGGALDAQAVALPDRLANAAISYVAYIGLTLRPAHLAFFYPFRQAWSWPQVAAGALLLAGVTGATLALRRRAPFLPVGWLWYLGTLVPMIGFVQAGAQAMADRYTYLPLVGMFVAAAWSLGALASKVPRGSPAAGAVAAAALLVLAALARRQTGVWRDDLTLYRHALARIGQDHMVLNNLGYALNRAGSYQEAVGAFLASIRLKPEAWRPYFGLADAFARSGRVREAENVQRQGLARNPHSHEGLNYLGLLLFRQGRTAEARVEFLAALRESPGYADPMNNLGAVALSSGKSREAEEWFRRAVAARSDFPEAHRGLGSSFLLQGRAAEAIPHLREALRLRPGFSEAAADLARAQSAAR